jgi:AraC-like DNA-binding protein
MAKLPEIKEVLKDEYDLVSQGHVVLASYFYFETSPDHNQQLAIVFGGFEKCAPDFEIKRKTYPYYILEYGIKGRCELRVGSHSNIIEPATIAGFAPGVPHHYSCDRGNPLEHFWIAYVGTEAAQLFEKSRLANQTIKLWPEALQLMDAIMAQVANKNQYSQQICCDYLRILLLLLAGRSDIHDLTPSGSAQTFEKCKKYIDQNFSTIVMTYDAARDCGVNVRYMSRLFKRYGGISPYDYICRLKLNKAANLLLTSKLSVNKIALAVGYEDPYHFSRNFKKFHGLSPKNYRSHHISG